MKSIQTEIIIDRPIANVWKTLMDFQAYIGRLRTRTHSTNSF